MGTPSAGGEIFFFSLFENAPSKHVFHVFYSIRLFPTPPPPHPPLKVQDTAPFHFSRFVFLLTITFIGLGSFFDFTMLRWIRGRSSRFFVFLGFPFSFRFSLLRGPPFFLPPLQNDSLAVEWIGFLGYSGGSSCLPIAKVRVDLSSS